MRGLAHREVGAPAARLARLPQGRHNHTTELARLVAASFTRLRERMQSGCYFSRLKKGASNRPFSFLSCVLTRCDTPTSISSLL